MKFPNAGVEIKFRFSIYFDNSAPYDGSEMYETRHDCVAACLDLIKWIKAHRPDLAEHYVKWSYHGEPFTL